MVKTLASFWAEFGQPEQVGVAKAAGASSVLLTYLPIKKIDDLEHRFGKEVSLGEVATRVVNQAIPATKGSVIIPSVEPVTIFEKTAEVDHVIADIKPDVRGNERARASRAIGKHLDDLFMNSAATAGSPVNGLSARCTGTQLITNADNGDLLTLEAFEALIDAVENQGNGRLAIMNINVKRQLKRLILAKAGGATVLDASGEIESYEGVKLVACGKKLDGTQTLDYNETCGSGTECASILCMAPGGDDVELSGVKLLQASNGIKIVDAGLVGNQYRDLISMAAGLAVYDNSAIARLQGITKLEA